MNRSALPRRRAPMKRTGRIAPAKRSPRRDVKRTETALTYAIVFDRADGHCECCGRRFGAGPDAPQMDHFLGRKKSENNPTPNSPEACWMLRAECHDRKTRNFPSFDEWAGLFVAHCIRRGFKIYAQFAHKKAEWIIARTGKVNH